jgi:hypothetical protein
MEYKQGISDVKENRVYETPEQVVKAISDRKRHLEIEL